MARSVMDAALFLDAMAGYDPRIAISIEAPQQSFQEAVRRAEPHVRIAYSPNWNGFAALDQEIDAVIREALRKIAAAGAMVDEACPALPDLEPTYVTLRAMLWAALPGRLPREVQDHFKQTLRDNIEIGRKLAAEQIYDAQCNRSVLYNNMQKFLMQFDVLACPTVGCEPGLVEEEYPRSVGGRQLIDYIEWLRFSFLATATGLPALSIPVGFTKSGMPVGMQLIGPPRGEAKLLRVARSIEQTLGLAACTPIDPVDRRHLIAST